MYVCMYVLVPLSFHFVITSCHLVCYLYKTQKVDKTDENLSQKLQKIDTICVAKYLPLSFLNLEF